MIYKLTREQEAQLEVYAEKWRKIGLSTECAKRAEVNEEVKAFYKFKRRPYPENIKWFESPDEMKQYAFENVIWDFRRKQWIESNTYNIKRLLTEKHIYWKAYRQIAQHFRRHLLDSFLHNLIVLAYRDNIFWREDYGYGLHDFGFLALIDYVKHVLGVSFDTTSIDTFVQITTNCCWWLPYNSTCCLCAKPSAIFLDTEQRFHSEIEPAILFRDGWGVYVWHGVRVPEWFILQSDRITPQKIMSEINGELRRVMIERYGQDNFIRDGGFTIQQSDDYGDLYRVEFDNGDEPIVAVHVNDASSDRDYFLYVPSHIRSAHEGVAWTFGYDNVSDYDPDQET